MAHKKKSKPKTIDTFIVTFKATYEFDSADELANYMYNIQGHREKIRTIGFDSDFTITTIKKEIK
jgi:hypothetical protein